jgi:hypothetical protein
MTNANRKPITVPPPLIDHSRIFGKAFVEQVKQGDGNANSLAVSGGRGSETDPELQARGKIGECAAAIYFGLSPRKLNWSLRPDGGADIVLPCGLRVDVKTTFPHYRLIWSRLLNSAFWQIDFDILLAVSIDENDYSHCWIEGWITKPHFFAIKNEADGSNGLEPGTWWVDKRVLSNVGDLRFVSPHLLIQRTAA